MNNACPECGAVYAVADKDIGRRISCKKCNSALIVSEEGLIPDEAGPPPRKDDTGDRDRPRRDDDERSGKRRRVRDDDAGDAADAVRKIRGPGAGEYLKKLKTVADVPTWLYGIGLFLTIYGFFGSALDKANTAGRSGKYDARKLEFEAYKRGIEVKPDGKAPTGDESKQLVEREKEWTKSTEPELQDDIKHASASEKKATWWNVMLKLAGFFLLAFGSIGFLKPDESPLKRLLGGVTILLILLQVIGGGVGIHVQAGGGGGG